MEEMMILPNPASVLRVLVTRAGFRVPITEQGLDKDLDDMASESRPSSTCDLMAMIEAECSKMLGTECGAEWTRFFVWAWSKCRKTLQLLAQNVDASPMADQEGRQRVVRLLEIPMLSGFLKLASSVHSGPVHSEWWTCPFAAWVQWVGARARVSRTQLLENLTNHCDVDDRTIERWMAGETLRDLRYPYRNVVTKVITTGHRDQLTAEDVDHYTAWLIIAVSVQSLSLDMRMQLKAAFETRQENRWTLEGAMRNLNEYASSRGDVAVRYLSEPYVFQLLELFGAQELDPPQIQYTLDLFKSLFSRESSILKRGCQYMHDWFSARLAAYSRKEDAALQFYEAAVRGVWWYGGPTQKQIISEALLYAVGVGKKIAAEAYWDKIFLLGLNQWPKRPLDEQELRRLALGFEQKFAPQKANSRVPPRVEVFVKQDPFTLTPQQIKKPNAKAKFAEGRTRRTPLMDAIMQGTLSDVQRLLDAGGDPNDFIKESGEGPLSYAMRRAYDRKDPEIMEHLLLFDLSPETINRRFSTRRETPLKLAIEMAHSNAVDRLIELGADIESECDLQPSALCYALSLLYGSIHTDDRTQELAYLAGQGRPDGPDAKDGAVLDVDLVGRRAALSALRSASPENERIFEAVKEYFSRSADDRRQVIHALLRHNANANRRYTVNGDLSHEWTPTLFAAQIGDLEIFIALVDSGGDPSLTLREPSSLQRFDALWVAVAYKRNSIVNYLNAD